MSRSRREMLSLAAGALAAPVAGCLGAVLPAGTTEPDGPTVGLETVAEGFTAPVGIEFPPGAEHGYVADQAGQVWVVDDDGRRPDPFLDLSDRIVSLDGYTEQGLLGLAFHPEFATEGRFYVRYSAPRRAGTPEGYSHTFVLSEFVVEGDPVTATRAVPDSERTLLEIPQPQFNHNAGSVAVGPDGYLYVGVGDGGGAGDRGDGHVADWYDPNPGGNGQDVTENLLGSVLRIDADGRDGDREYAIPPDNPLVDEAGLGEHYAWGFRNPWGLSFDDGRLFAADVGQDEYEEIDLVQKGGNYGWNVREARHCYEAEECPGQTPDGEPLRDPILEYPHERDGRTVGLAVVGGNVYRGTAIPRLEEAYVFGDWSGSFSTPQGSLFAAEPPEGDETDWSTSKLRIDGREDGELGRYVLGFGRDQAGEVYVCTSGRPGIGGSTGTVHRIVPPDGGTAAGTADDGGETATGSTPGETDDDGGTGEGDGGDGNADDGTTTVEDTPGLGSVAALVGIAGGIAGLRWRRNHD